MKVAAKNIGCHMNWGNAREDIQKLFSHFKSKDLGKLFHMKLMIAINPNDYHGLPYYIYVGSVGFPFFSPFGFTCVVPEVPPERDLCYTVYASLLTRECFSALSEPSRSANFSNGA